MTIYVIYSTQLDVCTQQRRTVSWPRISASLDPPVSLPVLTSQFIYHQVLRFDHKNSIAEVWKSKSDCDWTEVRSRRKRNPTLGTSSSFQGQIPWLLSLYCLLLWHGCCSTQPLTVFSSFWIAFTRQNALGRWAFCPDLSKEEAGLEWGVFFQNQVMPSSSFLLPCSPSGVATQAGTYSKNAYD